MAELPFPDDRRLQEAISFAAREHRNHLRKDGQTPCVAHVMRILEIAGDDRPELTGAKAALEGLIASMPG